MFLYWNMNMSFPLLYQQFIDLYIIICISDWNNHWRQSWVHKIWFTQIVYYCHLFCITFRLKHETDHIVNMKYEKERIDSVLEQEEKQIERLSKILEIIGTYVVSVFTIDIVFSMRISNSLFLFILTHYLF